MRKKFNSYGLINKQGCLEQVIIDDFDITFVGICTLKREAIKLRKAIGKEKEFKIVKIEIFEA